MLSRFLRHSSFVNKLPSTLQNLTHFWGMHFAKVSPLILLKVQPVFANFAEYPYPCPSFLPTSWEANKGLSCTLLGLWSPKSRSIHDSLLGLPSLHPVFGPFERINKKSSNLTLWMGSISAKTWRTWRHDAKHYCTEVPNALRFKVSFFVSLQQGFLLFGLFL